MKRMRRERERKREECFSFNSPLKSFVVSISELAIVSRDQSKGTLK